MLPEHRVVIVQFAGEYREAFLRLSEGGPETYYAQRYSVNSVAEIRKQVSEMTVITWLSAAPYDELLANGVRAIGAGFTVATPPPQIVSLVENLRPTELVVCTPNQPLLRWAVQHKIRTLALLADSFQNTNWRSRVRNFLLARLLNSPLVEWAANHNMNASRCLQKIGVAKSKIIPWDWAPSVTPDAYEPKSLSPNGAPYKLMYAGQITEDKGVGDVLEAVSQLTRNGIACNVRFAGKGDIGRFTELSQKLGIGKHVEFLGLVSNNSIIPLMRESDVVVIPSRHEYPEGLPLTIYEAMCSRTPIVASDHPMFYGKVVDNISGLVYSAGDPRALAEKLKSVLADSALYFKLSTNSAAAWKNLQIPVKFADLLRHWITNTPEDREWLASFRLDSGIYDKLQ